MSELQAPGQASQIVCRRSDLVGTGTCCTEGQGGEEETKGMENTGRQGGFSEKQEADKSIGLRERPTPGQSSQP